jgi:hypothetical protein
MDDTTGHGSTDEGSTAPTRRPGRLRLIVAPLALTIVAAGVGSAVALTRTEQMDLVAGGPRAGHLAVHAAVHRAEHRADRLGACVAADRRMGDAAHLRGDGRRSEQRAVHLPALADALGVTVEELMDAVGEVRSALRAEARAELPSSESSEADPGDPATRRAAVLARLAAELGVDVSVLTAAMAEHPAGLLDGPAWRSSGRHRMPADPAGCRGART